VAGAGSSCPRPLTRCAGDDGSRTADSRLGLGALLRRDGDLDGARPHLLAAANAYRRTGEWLALARATYNLALTEPVGSGERRNGLVASWLAMQSISWGLPEVSARADWRDTLDDATASTLSSALDSNNLCSQRKSSRRCGRPRSPPTQYSPPASPPPAQPSTTCPPRVPQRSTAAGALGSRPT
jgi:hypothetical protein